MDIYAPGARIGQYEIASHPMIGGMGVAYLCVDCHKDRLDLDDLSAASHLALQNHS